MNQQTLELFNKSIVSFFDELTEIYPKEPYFIRMRIYFNDQCDIKTVMENFIHYINKNEQEYKLAVKNRNEALFLESNLTEILNDDLQNVIFLKKLWRSPENEDNKEIMWKWFDSFVYLSDKYIKHKTREILPI